MIFEKFTVEHVEEAQKIALENYLEERVSVPSLPEDITFPRLRFFAEKGMGVAALEDGRLVGYLCCFAPWEGAFDSYDALGTFSPLAANGAVRKNRGRIYQDMYAHLSEDLAKENIIGLGVCLYAHDAETKNALFEAGFGMRCKDRVRLMTPDIPCHNTGLTFEEFPVEAFPLVRSMRFDLNEHLKKAPVFLQCTREEFEGWIARVEKGDRRTFVAKKGDVIAAYLDVAEEGENFVTDHDKMLNLQGAYCLPEFRGQKITDDLLNHVMTVLKEEGFEYLGVDHESYNPTANRFWCKYFDEYTNSVVRKIETWSFGK